MVLSMIIGWMLVLIGMVIYCLGEFMMFNKYTAIGILKDILHTNIDFRDLN